MGARYSLGVAAVVVIVLCAAHYRHVWGLGFLGHDTLPIVVSSVVESPGDVVRVLSEPHVGAPFWSLFYRPLLKLSYSLDHALYGFDARGYHVTSAVLLAVLSGLVFALARRLAGPGRPVAAWVALLVFLLHPVHAEVLPALERRGEVLCGVFLLLALLVQLSPRTLSLRRPALGPALLTLAAIASKETAIVLPALVAAAVWLWSPRATARERMVHGAVAALGPAAAVGVAAAVRLAVLGALGGHDTAGLSSLASSGEIAGLLLFPQPVLTASVWIPWLPLAAVSALAVVGFTGTRTRLADPVLRADLRAAAFGAVFTLVLIAIHAYTGKTSRWYLLLPAIGWALLLGPAADALWSAVRTSGGLSRVAAAVGLLALSLFSAAHARLSPVLHTYEEWPLAARSRDAYLEAIDERVRSTPRGRILVLEPFPNWVRFDREEYARRPTVHTAAILRRDSLEAWLRIAFPDKNVRVRRRRDGPFEPDPDVLLIVTDRRAVRLR
jgi:hypothetical protein